MQDEDVDLENEKRRRVVDVSADDLLNKDEFYRRQLQNHSLSMFHRQVVTRNKADDTAAAQEELAIKGKKRN